MDGFFSNTQLLWSLGLAVVVPILAIALGEIVDRFYRGKSVYKQSFDTLRKQFLPLAVLSLIGIYVIRLDHTNIALRLLLTALCFSGMFLTLSFIAAMASHEKDNTRWESHLPAIVKSVARVIAVLLPFGLLFAAVWDLDIKKYVAAIGFGSVAIAFALQSTLSSVVSGFLLALDKPFKEGDWIEFSGNIGKVLDLNWRTTRVEIDGRDVLVIPNTMLVDSELKNFTVLDEGYRDVISFGFSYNDLPNKVKDVALNVAAECRRIAKKPAPEVHLIGYGDSSVDYEMHFHLDRYESAFDAKRVRDDLLTRLFYAAARNNLDIPFPIRTVRSPDEGSQTREELSNAAKTSLDEHEIFSASKPETREFLAQHGEFLHYGRGTTISEIGQFDEGLFVILSGRVTFLDEHGDPHGIERAGGLIGVRYMVGRRANRLTTLATSDIDILFIPGQIVDKAMTDDIPLARALNNYADAQIYRFDQSLTPEDEDDG